MSASSQVDLRKKYWKEHQDKKIEIAQVLFGSHTHFLSNRAKKIIALAGELLEITAKIEAMED